MARNYNSNNSSGGCLLWIIGILLLAGNGALFSGSFDEMPLLCVLAILGDIFIIGAFIKATTDSPSKNNPTQASSNQSASQQVGRRSMPQSAPITVATDNEDNSKLNRMKSQYCVPAIPAVSKSVDPLQNEMESYQCIEVMQSVNKAISRRSDYAKKMKSIKEDIDSILACPGCNSDRERLKYIKSNEETLQQKKDEYTTASKEMKKIQIVLLSKEQTTFSRLSSALDEINSSEKSSSGSGVTLSSFIKFRSRIPGDLFISEQIPIELDYGAYKFFLLPDVVLVYDKEDSFVTALEPVALIITIRDQKKSVYKQKNSGSSWTYTDSVIAKDSVLLSEGYVRTRWLHEKKSGGPDLRYSHNPRYESRIDTYACSVFSIQIGKYKAEYSISKANLSHKLKPMVEDYCSVVHELNATPSLLRLLESVSNNRDAASLLSDKYESISKNIICKVS